MISRFTGDRCDSPKAHARYSLIAGIPEAASAPDRRHQTISHHGLAAGNTCQFRSGNASASEAGPCAARRSAPRQCDSRTWTRGDVSRYPPRHGSSRHVLESLLIDFPSHHDWRDSGYARARSGNWRIATAFRSASAAAFAVLHQEERAAASPTMRGARAAMETGGPAMPHPIGAVEEIGGRGRKRRVTSITSTALKNPAAR